MKKCTLNICFIQSSVQQIHLTLKVTRNKNENKIMYNSNTLHKIYLVSVVLTAFMTSLNIGHFWMGVEMKVLFKPRQIK